MHELTEALANIMADAINGKINETNARLALTAASRIVEAVQAETRVRALAATSRQAIPAALPLDRPIYSAPEPAPLLQHCRVSDAPAD